MTTEPTTATIYAADGDGVVFVEAALRGFHVTIADSLGDWMILEAGSLEDAEEILLDLAPALAGTEGVHALLTRIRDARELVELLWASA